ncbi:inter-alpha-trypsin inhibitor heavy chain H4-like isoform X3 [Hyposmocoma kahamanoa]|uniref:inter-alpha-trypsin inhibitor heavy chain H4-like isoform X3 n=1 Tax=Hyposmocoma kahamanoa TaxID=1477025 RepID=UPI000E6D7C8A|nr:inter-alpha-trypsin inhibitor heavy chain H4-like isoform X3 [Hyposmocoma kahamanoa]
MGPQWLTFVCVCVLAASTTLSEAFPTQETLVVAKSETPSTTPSVSTSHEQSSTPPSTERPLLPLKLTEMDVRSEVAMRYAHTAVVTTVKNPAHRAQEATFRVLLPETAFISGFTMILDGTPYKAYVKEKEEAKQIFNDAVSHGLGAAHIAAKARDSNHFTVSVNVEPNKTAVFNLTYEELLGRRNNVYNHAINLHPGVVVPKLTVTVHIKEAQKITVLRVPEVRTGNEIDATETDTPNSGAVIDRGHDDREATITFTPDINEQRRLMEIYAEKSKESQHGLWRPQSEHDKPIDGILGQFVVQYDVDRPKDGEILVNDGYFVHFFAPTALPPLAKHVVFVLDTSGSMSGRKINQLQQAMHTILSELNPGDYFSIVEFASSVTVHDLKEALEEPTRKEYNYYSWDYEKPATLLPPSPATPENISKAKVIVSRMTADGGTNIASALNVAVDLINKGVGWKPETNATSSTTPSTIEPIPEPAERKLAEVKPAEEKSEAKELDVAKEEKSLEPIIIFLTDGDPTVGETDPTRIINRISEKNSGVNKASLFSLAFGEDADRKFLRKISLRNEGFMRHIYEAADAALQLHDFYRQVSSPLLADVKFIYPADQVKKDSLTKHNFRTYYSGGETVVAGRVADGAVEISPHIIGICGVDDGFTKKRYEIFPKVPVSRNVGEYLPLERLWAYLTIKQLLDERDAADQPADKEKEDTPEKKALSIALRYEFVTPLTSLVVVKPNATNAVNAESVDKPNDYGFSTISSHAFNAYPLQLSAPQFGGAGFQGPPGQPALYRPEAVAMDDLINVEGQQIDYEEHDSDIRFETDRIAGQLYTTTPAPPPPPSFTTESSLKKYHIENLPWLQELLSPGSSTLNITVTKSEPNGTQSNTFVELELSTNAADDPPKEAGGDQKCAPSTNSVEGLCVYVSRCSAAVNMTATTYPEFHCKVENKYAGICCPSDMVDVKSN